MVSSRRVIRKLRNEEDMSLFFPNRLLCIVGARLSRPHGLVFHVRFCSKVSTWWELWLLATNHKGVVEHHVAQGRRIDLGNDQACHAF